MTEALYLEDSYLKEFEATVNSVDGVYVVLDKTCFYYQSGGQPTDTGKLIKDGEEYEVIFVKKINDEISHEVGKEGLQVGDKVKGVIDWERRYKLMRYHTGTHVLSGVFTKDTGALITGNQLNVDKTRIDFSLDNFDRSMIDECVKKSNEIIKQDNKVKTYFIDKEEALKDDSLIKLATRDFLEKLGPKIRIVEIEGFDKQLDGGTHVKSLKEVGKISILKLENKGKNNRRVYFIIE